MSHALGWLNIDQWKKEADVWVAEAPSKGVGRDAHGKEIPFKEIREIRNYFKGTSARGFWFRFDPVNDPDPSLSAPGTLRTIIKEYAESRCDAPSLEDMRTLVEEKGLDGWKDLSPIAKSRFIEELWRSWGQGDTYIHGLSLLNLNQWLVRFAQSEKIQDPLKKKVGRPSMRGATHTGAPKEVGSPEYQLGFALAVLWNRFVDKPETMDGRNREKQKLDATKPQTEFENFVECCVGAAKKYAKENQSDAFSPAFRTIRNEGLEPALRDFRRILKEDHREELEADLRDWR